MKCPKCGTPIRQVIMDYTQEQLRNLKQIINGKISRRVITEEQQAKMQAGKKRKGVV